VQNLPNPSQALCTSKNTAHQKSLWKVYKRSQRLVFCCWFFCFFFKYLSIKVVLIYFQKYQKVTNSSFGAIIIITSINTFQICPSRLHVRNRGKELCNSLCTRHWLGPPWFQRLFGDSGCVWSESKSNNLDFLMGSSGHMGPGSANIPVGMNKELAESPMCWTRISPFIYPVSLPVYLFLLLTHSSNSQKSLRIWSSLLNAKEM
jgi:hypothetical protein